LSTDGPPTPRDQRHAQPEPLTELTAPQVIANPVRTPDRFFVGNHPTQQSKVHCAFSIDGKLLIIVSAHTVFRSWGTSSFTF
jgi:hypothetical protein